VIASAAILGGGHTTGHLHLTLRAKITRPAQILHLLDLRSALGTGFPSSGAIHQTNITTLFAKQVRFIVAPALLNNLTHGIDDRVIQILPLPNT
jgi:hypothetical protein